jgi:hypothetical protein
MLCCSPTTLANITNGNSFALSWTTDEPATSSVTFSCSGSFNDSSLVTSHSMSFRGSKGATYVFKVSSTDADGNTATAGPFTHSN